MANLIKIKQIDGLQTQLGQKANDSQVLKIANNLSELNAASVRAQIDVHSKSEVSGLLAGISSGKSVADIAARNALTGLKVTDKIFVSNDGDGKWAYYMVTAITNGNGSTSTFEKLADKDVFDNAMTASAIKTAYESNANTNAFTSAEKTKLGLISASQAVNLDTIKSQVNTLLTDVANANTNATSALGQLVNKQDKFNETHEVFTNMVVEPDMDNTLTLSRQIMDSTEVMVFFNSLRISGFTFNYSSNKVIVKVPYLTESTDEIVVYYKY